MQVTYNNAALHALGYVYLVGEATSYEPADSAQRRTVTLNFIVEVWEQTYSTNRNLLLAAKEAFKTSNAQLKVEQEAVNSQPGSQLVTLYDQLAHVTADDFPSDGLDGALQQGTYRQQLHVSFTLELHDITTNAIQCQWTAAGETSPLTMTTVTGYKENIQVARYDEMRDPRSHAAGSITVHGEFHGDMSKTLSARRADLFTLKEDWQNKLNQRNGRLVYLTFDRTVRVTSIDVDVDQATEKMVWSFTAVYTRFPNEAGYAGADYAVDLSFDAGSGESVLSLSGRVLAQSEANAAAKVDLIRTAVLTAHGFTLARRSRNKASSRNLATDDTVAAGEAVYPATAAARTAQSFVSLNFDEEFRQMKDTQLSHAMTVSDQEDTENGLITRTYSGRVISGYVGGNAALSQADKAYQLAVNKAKALGENKHPFRVSGSIVREDREIGVSAGLETVAVTFSFVYKVRGTRIYIEINTSTSKSTFGEDSVSVSGYVVGGDQTALDTAYATVLSNYPGYLIRNEQKKTVDLRVASGAFQPTLGADVTVAAVWQFTTVPGFYKSPGGNSPSVHRMDFSFDAFQPKTLGTYAIKYGFRVSTNFRTLSKTTVIEGAVFGTELLLNAIIANTPGNVLELLLGVDAIGKPLNQGLNTGNSLGRSVDRERSLSREFKPGVTISTAFLDNYGAILSLNFSETFEGQLAGDNAIIECSVNEDLQFSGIRNVVVPNPSTNVEVQNCGIVEGRRTLTGSVTAANETICLAWIKRQTATTYPSGAGMPSSPAEKHQEPVRISLQYVFSPFAEVDGSEAMVRGSLNAPKVVTANFTYSEIVPDFPYV